MQPTNINIQRLVHELSVLLTTTLNVQKKQPYLNRTFCASAQVCLGSVNSPELLNKRFLSFFCETALVVFPDMNWY